MERVLVVDAATGGSIERDFTQDEMDQRGIDAADAAAKAQAEADALAARGSARQKIAAASGLTPEEMAALGL